MRPPRPRSCLCNNGGVSLAMAHLVATGQISPFHYLHTQAAAMPRCLRFNQKPKRKLFLSEERRAACVKMNESELDAAAFRPPNITTSPASSTNPQEDRPEVTKPPKSISSPASALNLADILQNKPRVIQAFGGGHDPQSAAITLPSDLSFLQFRPSEDTDYARPFARAVLAAYRAELVPGANFKDRDLAERIVGGEGGGLVFRRGFVASNEVCNGKDPRIRRAALTHILGVLAEDCGVQNCPYRGTGCLGCLGSGMFEGCKHSHELSKKLRCSNCCVGTVSTECSIRSRRKESMEYQPQNVAGGGFDRGLPVLGSCSDEARTIGGRDSKMFFPYPPTMADDRPTILHGPLQEPQRGPRDRKKSRASKSQLPTHAVREPSAESAERDHLPRIGPVLNDFFISRKQGAPSDFDIWMSMRKRAIDYDPGVLAMECRLARLWSSVLEDELGKQRAAGLETDD